MIPPISRIVILTAIASHFQMASQFLAGNGSDYYKYICKAEALIEILEIDDCGSVGGFDKMNPNKGIVKHLLFNRFLTLIAKYPELKGEIKLSCGYTLDTLTRFYDSISGLRNKAILNQE
jgi:hypothetical protein